MPRLSRKGTLQREIETTLLELLEDGALSLEDLKGERVRRAVQESLKSSAISVRRTLRRQRPAMLAEHAEIRAGFEERLRETWAEGLAALETVIVSCFEAGEEVFKEDRRRAIASDPRFAALVLLHARACNTADEILVLLRSGHASGALARWRTLHEIAVISQFLKQEAPRIAERYMAHADVLRAKRIVSYQAFAERLGEVPLTPAEETSIRAARDRILAEVPDPKGFKSEWGWAGEALGNPEPKFVDILKAVKLEFWQPLIESSHSPVHAGSAGFVDVGNDSDGRFFLAGPSDAGLIEVGHRAAISLMQATVSLLVLRPTMDRMLMLYTILALVDDVAAGFVRGRARYDRLKARARREQRERERRRRPRGGQKRQPR
jgi:hypothetical protein